MLLHKYTVCAHAVELIDKMSEIRPQIDGKLISQANQRHFSQQSTVCVFSSCLHSEPFSLQKAHNHPSIDFRNEKKRADSMTTHRTLRYLRMKNDKGGQHGLCFVEFEFSKL